MATYSYILCSNCGGTGWSNETACPKCEGARMTGALVDEHLFRILDVTCCDLLENDSNEQVALAQFA